MRINTLTIVIPVYNEERYVTTVLKKLMELELPGNIGKEIIVVNDGSTDNTEKVILDFQGSHRDLCLRYFSLPHNQGKGAALHRGIKEARGEYLIVQDADLEYDPIDIPRLLEPVLEGKADVVCGSRFISDRPHRVLYYWHYQGNKLLTTLTNMVSNLNMTDMETCYKLFDTKLVQGLTLKEKRFGFEPEVVLKLSRIPDIRMFEVGISYAGRTYAEGKKINAKDGFRALWCISKYGLFRRN